MHDNSYTGKALVLRERSVEYSECNKVVMVGFSP